MKRALVWGSGVLVVIGLVVRFAMMPSGTVSSESGATPPAARAMPPTPATASTAAPGGLVSSGHNHPLESLQTRLIRSGRLELPQDACDHDRTFYADAVAFAQDGRSVHDALRAAYNNRIQRQREENEAHRKTSHERAEKRREESKVRADGVRSSRPPRPGTNPPPAPPPLGPAFKPAETEAPKE